MPRCTVKIAWILGMTEASPGQRVTANITMFNFNVPSRFFEIHKKVKIQLKHGKVGWAQQWHKIKMVNLFIYTFYNVQMFP